MDQTLRLTNQFESNIKYLGDEFKGSLMNLSSD